MANLRQHVKILADILENDECQCEAWTERGLQDCEVTHPAEHAQYCPVYLAAYLQALADGKEHPDPDSWPDAPSRCEDCGFTRGRHHDGCPSER